MTRLPDHIDIPKKYWPPQITHQGFSPSLLRQNAEHINTHMFDHKIEVYSGILLFLLDNIDWDKFNDNAETQIVWPTRA